MFVGSIVCLSNDIDNGLINNLGLGFIKDFDLEKGIFYIITPLADQVLQKVKYIVKSSEIDFTKSFFNKSLESEINIQEINQDIELKMDQIRELNFPFVFHKTIGVGT